MEVISHGDLQGEDSASVLSTANIALGIKRDLSMVLPSLPALFHFFFFFVFSGAAPAAHGAPRLGVELEL